jgi:hypothetical protein
MSAGWQLVFDLTARLAQAPWVKNLRLVVWFDR